MQTFVPYQLGFSSQYQEQSIDRLPVQGAIPNWLTGSLIRTGPGQFEVGAENYQHWFDGLAMLRRFSFHEGQVSFQNQFLRSKAYLEAKQKDKISRGEFGTVARHSIWERLRDPIPRLTDNASVNITMLDDRYVSITESPFPILFDPETLQTLDRFKYDDRVNGQITTAHPHIDHQRGAIFSYLTCLAPRYAYNIYRQDWHSRRRHLVASIPIAQPAYMHSFAMTEQYIVLTEFSLRLKPISLLVSGRPFIENCEWQPDQPTRILVVRKDDGQVVRTCLAEPFFAFHHVNAFEQEDEVLIDLITYPDDAVVRSLYLEPLRHHPEQVIGVGELRRYHVPVLSKQHATYETLSADRIELPRIHYARCNMHNYRFVYGIGSQAHQFSDQLVKVDVVEHESQIWRSPNCYPGEPVFAAAPNASNEDEGVVLSVVLDAQQQRSFLLVLDARSFTEIARAELPYHLPFDFHGQYFEDTEQSDQQIYLHR